MKQIAVLAQSISASLENAQVLHGIDLSITAGRWTSIVGPNGAGKSTLLKVLAGLLPHSGPVTLLGQPLHSLSARTRAQQLAWLGQNESSATDHAAVERALRAAHAPETHTAIEQVFDHRLSIHAVAGQWVVLPRL